MNPDPELLARLRDLHAPPEPPWWPPAPGWWLALLLALVLTALAVRVLRPRWRRWRLRRRLLAALQAIARRHEAGAPPHATAAMSQPRAAASSGAASVSAPGGA